MTTWRDASGQQIFEGDRIKVEGTVTMVNGRIIDFKSDIQPKKFDIISHLDCRVLEKKPDA